VNNSDLASYTVQDKILEGENFGEFGEFYPIHQNFLVQFKIDFKKLSYREYFPIYYPPIIADSLFVKIFSLQNFVSYGIWQLLYLRCQNVTWLAM